MQISFLVLQLREFFYPIQQPINPVKFINKLRVRMQALHTPIKSHCGRKTFSDRNLAICTYVLIRSDFVLSPCATSLRWSLFSCLQNKLRFQQINSKSTPVQIDRLKPSCLV